MVSSAKIEMTARVFMQLTVDLHCGEKCQGSVHFLGRTRETIVAAPPLPLFCLDEAQFRRINVGGKCLNPPKEPLNEKHGKSWQKRVPQGRRLWNKQLGPLQGFP